MSNYWLTKTGEILGEANSTDTDLQISLNQLNRQFQKGYLSNVEVSSVTSTLTSTDFNKGILTSIPIANITLTTPPAASIIAADMDAAVGRGFEINIINLGGGHSIALAAGTGVTLVGTVAVPPHGSARFYARYVNVSSGTQAVTIFRLA